jgi:hypothetical protein
MNTISRITPTVILTVLFLLAIIFLYNNRFLLLIYKYYTLEINFASMEADLSWMLFPDSNND